MINYDDKSMSSTVFWQVWNDGQRGDYVSKAMKKGEMVCWKAIDWYHDWREKLS